MLSPNHLGGHAGITHVDAGALQWVARRFRISSMLDIGCGPGGMRQIAERMDIEWQGIDGDPNLPPIPGRVRHDFTTGPKAPGAPEAPRKLAWSVEFLEHIDERHLPNVWSAFSLCEYALITAAPPHTHGHHHVNCQPAEYWVRRFDSWGFAFLPADTTRMRAASTMKRDFMRRHGLLFKRI
jgi:hypothetical protein